MSQIKYFGAGINSVESQSLAVISVLSTGMLSAEIQVPLVGEILLGSCASVFKSSPMFVGEDSSPGSDTRRIWWRALS